MDFTPDNDEEEHEQFSDDPEENLRMQNELLKLKMQAEMGAEFGGDMSDLPPEIEQQILKQVMAFHEAQGSGEMRTVGQQLGQQEWPLASTFSSGAELKKAYDDVERRLMEARLHVGFLADYPLALKWDFITQELMKKETFPIEALEALQFGLEGEDDAPREGNPDNDTEEPDVDLTASFGEEDDEDADDEGPRSLQGVGFMGFIYEEFHPNHAHTLERYALDTLREIFEGTVSPESGQLVNPMLTDKGMQVPLEELVEKVTRFHDLFAEIKSWEFLPRETVWDTETDDNGTATTGTGYVEGAVRYTVVTDDSTETEISGPYKIYFNYRDGYWQGFFFQLHGFSWA